MHFPTALKSPTCYTQNQLVNADSPARQRQSDMAYLAFLSKTGEKTSKKFSFASLLEGTELSKVGSMLLNARRFTGSDSIS